MIEDAKDKAGLEKDVTLDALVSNQLPDQTHLLTLNANLIQFNPMRPKGFMFERLCNRRGLLTVFRGFSQNMAQSYKNLHFRQRHSGLSLHKQLRE